MRVMTYNIRHGLGNASPDGKPAGASLARIAGVIERHSPDIVAVQEVDRFWARSGRCDQPASLARLLGMNVFYAANVVLPSAEPDVPAREYGVATLTRLPVVAQRVVPLPVAPGWEPRGMSLVEVVVASRHILVVNTHLQVDQPGQEDEGRRQRAAQVAAVCEAVRYAGLPAIVMGDFNGTPEAPELAGLFDPVHGLRDAWTINGRGAGATIPAAPDREAVERIDYILTSDAFAIERVGVMIDDAARLASDHFPMVADMVFGRGRTVWQGAILSPRENARV